MFLKQLKSAAKKLKTILEERNSFLVIDLGTANTLIYVKDKGLVVNEPTIIAINKKVNKVVAIGNEARKMSGKTPPHIEVIKPVEYGVIYDFEATKRYLNLLIENSFDRRFSIFRKITVLTSCPPSTDDVQLKALEDVFHELEFEKVIIIKETFLAAIGVNLKIMEPKPNFIIDMGGGTTNMALISLGEAVIEKSLKVGGTKFDQNIQEYIREKFDLIIGEETAQRIKLALGSAIELEKRLELKIAGKLQDTLLPGEVNINDIHIRSALAESIDYIIEETQDFIKKIPPELMGELIKQGIYLTGGSSLLRGIKELFERKLGFTFHRPQNPFVSIINGGIEVLKNPTFWQPLFLNTK